MHRTSSNVVRGRRLVALAAAVTVTLSLAGSSSPASTASEKTAQRARALTDANLPAGALSATATASGKTRTLDPASRLVAPTDYLTSGLDSKGDEHNPRVYVDAARAYVERQWGVKVPHFGDRVREARPAAGGSAPLDPSSTSTDRYGLPAGDLTGDGLDDVMSVEVTFADETFELVGIALRGVKGTDGSQLWSLDLSDVYDLLPIPAGDLTGDGAGDVLLLAFYLDSGTYVGPCALVACALVGEFTYHWEIAVISGPTGAEAWSHTYSGELTEAFAFAFGLVALADADAFTATNILVFPALSDDHNGDGSPDLVINAYDVTSIFGFQYAGGLLAAALVQERLSFARTRAEVASGDDGTGLFTRGADYTPGGSALLPAGQTVGGATGDLLWETAPEVATPIACVFSILLFECAGYQHTTLSLEMLDGAGFSTAWTAEIDEPDVAVAYADPAGVDLGGDGSADLLLFELTGSEVRQGVVSGADGAVAWTKTADGFLVPIGAIGGGAGGDLLLMEFGFDETTFDLSVSLDRLDGTTGAVLLSTTHTVDTPDYGFAYVYVFLLGDGDGDGVLDPVVGSETFDFDSGEISSAAIAESGATGAELLGTSVSGVVVFLPAGDEDGDGKDDLFKLLVTFSSASVTLTTKGVRLPSGAEAWTRADSFLPASFILLYPTRDQSGLGGADAAYSRLQLLPTSDESRVDGLEGLSGALTWGFGDTLTLPPPLGAGSISGLVTDESLATLEGICVSAFTDSGGFASSATTNPAGIYSIGGLGTGSYRVSFQDCAGGAHAEEWYEDQLDFGSADEVAVTDGVDTPGIDAILATIVPPDNDDIADAVIIAALPYSDARSTTGATVEADEAEPCGGIQSTVWYKLTVAALTVVDANTFGSDYDTVLAVYSGADPSSLTNVACNDDAVDLQSDVIFVAGPGQTYWLQAGGYYGESGSLELAVSAVIS